MTEERIELAAMDLLAMAQKTEDGGMRIPGGSIKCAILYMDRLEIETRSGWMSLKVSPQQPTAPSRSKTKEKPKNRPTEAHSSPLLNETG